MGRFTAILSAFAALTMLAACGSLGAGDAASFDRADVPIDGSLDGCPTIFDGGSCFYAGYGTSCRVPCSLAPACRFTLAVTWGGNGYCCAPVGNSYESCACLDGLVYCAPHRAAPPDLRTIPVSNCEFCLERDVQSVDASALDE